MKVKHLFLFTLLIASVIAYRKRDDEGHGNRWQRRQQNKALADLETKLAEDVINVEPLPENANGNSNFEIHRGWRRKDCRKKNEGQADDGSKQNDVRCERQRTRELHRRGNDDRNEEDPNGNKYENHRPRGWYRKAKEPDADYEVNNQDENEDKNIRRHRYVLKKREHKNYNEQTDDKLIVKDEKNDDEDIKSKKQHRSWYQNGNNNVNVISKWHKYRNIPMNAKENDLNSRGNHHHHHHKDLPAPVNDIDSH